MWLTNYMPIMHAGLITKNQKKKSIAQYESDIQFQNEFMNLLLLSMYRYEYKGLPESCDARVLEFQLISSGKAVFVNDPDLDILNLNVSYIGQNVYGLPIRVRATGVGYSKEYKASDVVIIRANPVEYPLLFGLEIYANKISDAGRTIDVNSKRMKSPYFILAGEEQVQSARNIVSQIEDNEQSVVTTKDFDVDNFKVFPVGNSSFLQDLWNHKNNLKSECYTQMGMNNLQTNDKKERLLEAEVSSNDDVINSYLMAGLETRKQAIEELNSKWGCSATVELITNEDVSRETLQEEGGQNVQTGTFD